MGAGPLVAAGGSVGVGAGWSVGTGVEAGGAAGVAAGGSVGVLRLKATTKARHSAATVPTPPIKVLLEGATSPAAADFQAIADSWPATPEERRRFAVVAYLDDDHADIVAAATCQKGPRALMAGA